MRVAHLLRKYDPAEWGGTETAIRQLSDGLAQHGVESVVYAPAVAKSRDGGTGKPAVAKKSPGQDPVKRFRAIMPVVGVSAEVRSQLVAIGGNLISLDLPFALAREPGIRVVHSHALGRLGAIAHAVARMRRLPFVMSVHGGAYDLPTAVRAGLQESRGLDWGKAVGWALRARTLFDATDAVVTCNPREAELIRERHPKARVVVQPHGVPTTVFATDQRAAARAAFPAIIGRKVLLMPGRVDPVKNQHWVVAEARELARRHPDVLVVLAGPCTNPPYGAGIEQFIRDAGLSSHVLLVGGIPSGDPRLIGLVQEAQAVLLPSLSETFGLVILESWAAGTPVISSRTSGASALVEEGRNGYLFDLGTPAGFHSAVDRILGDSQARYYLGEAGRRKAVSGYDTVALAGRMKDLYAELVAQSGRSIRRPLECTT